MNSDEHEEQLACPISTFAGFEDAEVRDDDPWAWHAQTAGEDWLCLFPGDRFSLHDEGPALVDTICPSLGLRSLVSGWPGSQTIEA